MTRSHLGPALVAVLAAGTLPAAAATVTSSAEVTLTVLSATDGLVFEYDPFVDEFSDSFGAGTASTTSSVASEDTFSTVAIAASAAAVPTGDAEASAGTFETAFVENLSDTAGSLVLEVVYELSVDAQADGPFEFAFGAAAFEIFEFLPDADAVEIVSYLVEDAVGDPLFDVPSDGPASLSGTETFTLTFAPFEAREFDIGQDAFAFAVAAQIPLPATGALLLGALAAAGGWRRLR